MAQATQTDVEPSLSFDQFLDFFRRRQKFVDVGWDICDMLVHKPNGAIMDELYQQGKLHRTQIQVLINIAQNRLCRP